jgi:hypothetical protein
VPEPWPLPDFDPLLIIPADHYPKCSKLPKRINPKDALAIFDLFFTKEVLDTLAEYTNKYAEQKRAQDPDTKRDHARPWYPTSSKELSAYIGVLIWMGLHDEAEIESFWNTNAELAPIHKPIQAAISCNRFEQIERYFHISLPRLEDSTGSEAAYQKVAYLSDHIRHVSRELWEPTEHLTVDEAMARFSGRSKEKVNIPTKPIPEGFKIWCLANIGYLLDWRFHHKGAGLGPVGLQPQWRQQGFSPTEAVVLDLLLSPHMPPDKHVVWLDNLFTSCRLLSKLREEGIGGAGTVKTSKSKDELMDEGANEPEQSPLADQDLLADYHASEASQNTDTTNIEDARGLNTSLRDLKTLGDQIPWGKLYGKVSNDGKVMEFAWKDNAVVLFMSTVARPGVTIQRRRRRPGKTRTGASITRRVFKDEVIKELSIPEFIDLYNHFMNGVDRHDQLRCYYFTQRRHLKSWKALWHWLLDVAVVNSYKLSWHTLHYEDPDLICDRYTKQLVFRRDLALALFKRSQRILRHQRPRASLNYTGDNGLRRLVQQELPRDNHTLQKLPRKSPTECVACKAYGRVKEKVRRPGSKGGKTRVPLRELDSNSEAPQRGYEVNSVASRTRYGCLQCGITLCPSGPCWTEHLDLCR